MENKFFTFIKPYLSFIDNGDLYRKPISWLYVFFAVINMIFPLLVFIMAVDNHIFRTSGKVIFVFLLVWIILLFAGWVSFQLWWDRKAKVNNITNESDDFVATPVFSHLIQTAGEWLGTWIAIVGFAGALLTTIFLGDDGDYFMYKLGLDFIGSGWAKIFIMPIYGYLIILITRFLAEQYRALVSIANNTKKK